MKPTNLLPLRWPTWAGSLIVAVATVGLGACIIGPKQDDPEAADMTAEDTGTGMSTDSARVSEDTAPGLYTETGIGGDASVGDTAFPPTPDGGGCGADASDDASDSETGDGGAPCAPADGGADVASDG